MNIDSAVLNILGNAVINENALTLTGQLDRKLYEATNKVLELAGGKWNRKAKAHLFDGDAAEIMDTIILTGQITNKKQDLGQFFSPKPVVKFVLERAKVKVGMSVLEPNAGDGAFVVPLICLGASVEAYEIDPKNLDKLVASVATLENGDFDIHGCDFLTATPRPIFDRVIMNPPFARQVDIQHVRHAYKFLKPGGLLVSVMSASVEFRTNKLTTEFRQFIEEHNGTIERLPEGSFLESGTGINTVVVTLEA